MLSTYIQFLCFVYTTLVAVDNWKNLSKIEKYLIVVYLTIFGAMATIAIIWLYISLYSSLIYIVNDYIYIIWAIINTHILTKTLKG